MVKDILRETLTSIRNAILIKKSRVEIPATRMTKALSRILYEEGLIEKILRSHPSQKKKEISVVSISKVLG
jgi:ribosomal protein S8